ncbi:unnamed protein product [Phaeothamnion confervicola]
MLALMRFPKPVVAAINGPAVGIGTTLLLHCDMTYATPTAFFWMPFFRLALVPEFCSSTLLAAAVGPARANEMLLFGRRLEAAEAASAGLISAVLPADGFLQEVRRRVTEGLTGQPLAAASAPIFKRLLREPERVRLEALLAAEFDALDARFRAGEPQAAQAEALRQRREAKMGKPTASGTSRPRL